MTNPKISQIIREELAAMLKEADDSADKIETKLEAMRKKLTKTVDRENMSDDARRERPMKRVQIKTVSDTIDIPLNELMLYFLNNVKTKNERSLVEYRLGHVYFYAE